MSKSKPSTSTKDATLRSIAENVNHIRWEHERTTASDVHDILNVAAWLVVLQIITIVTLFVIVACVAR